ncbi:MAG TPA: ParA family protein [Casimicrobium sp.]|nr:ParA family protein [Burkholderiales bacterium]HPG60492.1 ParA family protein [Casimicrobium sp.]
MYTILVANPKGGAGKSTLTTNIAGMLAQSKQRVVIMDLDKQQSATNWLSRRPGMLPRIMSWSEDTDMEELRAFAPQWMVIDTHARLRRADRTYLLSRANLVLVPVNPSVFDIEATAKFLIKLHQDANVQSGKVKIGLVGSRTDSRTRMAQELNSFFKRSGLPVVMFVPDSVVYPQCARDGVSIYDLPRNRTENQLDAWQPLVDWIKEALAKSRADAADAAAAAALSEAHVPQHGVVQVA